jgi:4-amino-4-deoxy-L-arabinose transferase-like glycosyltransferase
MSSASKLKIVPTLRNFSHKYSAVIILTVSLALIFFTQAILNFAYWFGWDLSSFGILSPLACIWPDFCDLMRFPRYGFVALITALLAAILIWSWLRWKEIPDLIDEPHFLPMQFPSPAKLNFGLDGSLIVLFGLCEIYVTLRAIADQPVFPLVWLAGLLILLFMGWRLDQSRGEINSNQLLSRGLLNGLYLGGIASLLLTTAALHSQRWLLGLILAAASVLMWLRVCISQWKTWDIPSRWERVILPLITLESFLLLSYRLNTWERAYFGDEYYFFDLAKVFAHGGAPVPILSGAGVYGIHPVLSTVLQSITIWLFGADGYGWRVSSSFLLAISIPFFYYFLRPILGRLAGLFAVALYGNAHVLLSLVHYGANNVQIIIVMAASLAAFFWAGRRGSWAGFVLTGFCLGFGFYLYAVARIYSLIIAVWLTAYYFPINLGTRRIHAPNIGVWLTVAGTALLTALPVLSTRSAWVELAHQTVLSSEFARTPADQFLQFLKNSLYGSTSFLFNSQNDLWIFGAHADPITSTLMIIGLAALLVPGKQTWRVRISLLASYVLFVLIIAGTQQYDYPNITRIFSFVPFYAIFAAVGAVTIFRFLAGEQGQDPAQRRPASIFAAALLAVLGVAIPLNFWQSNVLSQEHSAQYAPSFLLQAAQMSADPAGKGPHLFYVGEAPYEMLETSIYEAYNIPPNRYSFVLSRDALQANNVICQSADQPAIAMITAEIQDSGIIAKQLQECWPGSELRLIKDARNIPNQYRLINKSAVPFIHWAGGYWVEEALPQTLIAPFSDNRAEWTAFQPVGLSKNSTGLLGVVEATTKQIIFLDARGHLQSKLQNTALVDPADVIFLPDDGFVIADAAQGLLWFDSSGHFRFKSDPGPAPRGLFLAGDGTLYIASASGRSVIQVDNKGQILRIVTGPQFQQPTSVAVAPDGRIAVGDPAAATVTINSSSGELLAQYPIGAGDTRIDKPGLLWLPDDSFIYTDPANNQIIWLDAAGKIIKTWHDLRSPTDLVLQSADKILVLEGHDNRISSIKLK